MTATLAKAASFLATIGITVIHTDDPLTDQFIPGLEIAKGCVIRVNPTTLRNHADILHEAGHLAIMPQPFRDQMHGNTDESVMPLIDAWFNEHGMMDPVHTHIEMPFSRALLQASELEAIAWSYAAALEACIDPIEVFKSDEHAYNGEGPEVLFELKRNSHLGINGLAHADMTTRQIYPKMLTWTQQARMPNLIPA